MSSLPTDTMIAAILKQTRHIAVVGFSANPDRPSHSVAAFLQSRGYEIHPVNPGLAETKALGRTIYARLADIPVAIDMVDIFRNSESAGGVVDEALMLNPLPKTIWMQLGVVNEEAARRAEAKGVAVVMDRCPKIELARLSL